MRVYYLMLRTKVSPSAVSMRNFKLFYTKHIYHLRDIEVDWGAMKTDGI
jgi:hypothetical protein